MTSEAKSVHPALVRRGAGLSADGEFNLPTRVLFGRGISSEVGKHAKVHRATRVLLVVDPGVRSVGLVDPVVEDLHTAGLDVVVFSEVEPNPRDVDCIAGAA